MKKARRYPRSGFTLVEVLVVLALIALIAGVGGGYGMGTYKRILVERTARDFFLTAKYARIMAIERQKQYRIQLSTTDGGGGFCLATEQLNVETEQTEAAVVRDMYSKPVEFTGDIRFEAVQITPIGSQSSEEQTSIVFFPNGTAQAAVIQIGDGGNHYTVNISAATGRAKVHPGTADEVVTGTIDLDQQ